ncbi:uracil-DNA glycosylase-like protein [Aspergillus granulosus]|uniref:Uracil-DNA glycosylase-like protein n=1 Tax=Aspergillus granulosus TaxID=176169 RepID=A0ABR4HAJ4_9EURO
MGRLIKNHWARLIVLTASVYQVGSAVEAFIWPKIFWDVWTKNLDGAVKPVPILQILNLVMGLIGIAWEWPLKYLAGSFLHRSIEFRLLLYPLSAILAALIYQGTNAALYYLVGMAVYFWAYSEGEVVCPEPWTLPKRTMSKTTDSGDDNGSGLVIAADDDVPVNQARSFNGALNKYMHVSETSSSSASPQEVKRQSDALDAQRTSKRRKGLASTTTTLAATSTPGLTVSQRITRSKSRSATPVSPSLALRSESPSTLPSTPEHRQGRSRGSTPRKTSSPSSLQTSLLRDTIPPNLTLLLIGVNPGIMTGTTGFAYAHPSNLFWKLLHWSGITTVRHPPSDTYRLPELYNVGNTNIVERPTRDASMLSKAEMDAGVPILEAKIAAKRPEAVCLVGKSIWESVWRAKKGRAIKKAEFRYGWQDEGENMGRCEGWNGAKVFVATTTSGLAAGMSLAEKQAVWNELGSWVVARQPGSKELREERRENVACGYIK